MQGTHHLQPGQHAKHTVELATGGLRIEVAADRDRLAGRIAPRTAEHHVAEPINAQREARRLAPALEQGPALGVQIGQGLAVTATLRRRTDLCHVHEAIPEPGGGERKIVRHGLSAAQHAAPVQAVRAC